MVNVMSDPDLNSVVGRLEVIEAREAIKELKASYARGADAVFNNPGNASAVALADLFTADGSLELGPFGAFSGRAELLNAFENVLPQATKWSAHYILSPKLSINGATATGSWYYLIWMLPAGDGAEVIHIYGGYEDEYAKTEDGWKIKSSKALFSAPPESE